MIHLATATRNGSTNNLDKLQAVFDEILNELRASLGDDRADLSRGIRLDYSIAASIQAEPLRIFRADDRYRIERFSTVEEFLSWDRQGYYVTSVQVSQGTRPIVDDDGWQVTISGRIPAPSLSEPYSVSGYHQNLLAAANNALQKLNELFFG